MLVFIVHVKSTSSRTKIKLYINWNCLFFVFKTARLKYIIVRNIVDFRNCAKILERFSE